MAIRRKVILETPNRRLRKRKRLMRKFFLYIIILSLVAAGIFYFFRIPAFLVSEVTVIGAQKIDPVLIKNEANALSNGYIAYFIPKRFFFFYPRSHIASSLLKNHQEIKASNVTLKGARRAKIEIVERSAYAFYCTSNCFIADDEGLVYEEATTTKKIDEGKVTFHDKRFENQNVSLVGTYPLASQTFKDIERFAQKLKDLKLALIEIIIETNGDLTILTEEGRLFVSALEPIDPQYEFLKIALSQKMFMYPDGAIRSFSYIDLRFGKKIFYSFHAARAPLETVDAVATSTPGTLDI